MANDIKKYKDLVESRIKKVNKITFDEKTSSQEFISIAKRINSLVDASILVQTAEEARKCIQELNSIKKVTSLFAQSNQITSQERNLFLITLGKANNILREAFKAAGGIQRSKKLITPDETITGRVKNQLTRNFGESVGAAALALTDSPLLLIAGNFIDEQIDKRRNRKIEQSLYNIDSEQAIINSLIKKNVSSLTINNQNKVINTPTNQVNNKNKAVKIKKISKNKNKTAAKPQSTQSTGSPKIKNSSTQTPQTSGFNAPNPASLKNNNVKPIIKEKNDPEYLQLIQDLKKSSAAAFDDLDTPTIVRNRFYEELENKNPAKINDKTSTSDNKLINKKPNNTNQDRENNSLISSSSLSELISISKSSNSHLKKIDSNIEEIINTLKGYIYDWNEVNDEQLVNKRDKWLENISKKSQKKDNSSLNNKDENGLPLLKSIPELLTGAGKFLAGAGAFGAGWLAGNGLDKLFGLSEKIQKMVDNSQNTVEDHYQKSKNKNLTTKAITNSENVDSTKKKLNITTLTNKNAADIVKNPEALNKLNDKEKTLITNKASAYNKASVSIIKPSNTASVNSMSAPQNTSQYTPPPQTSSKKLPVKNTSPIAYQTSNPIKSQDTSSINLKPGVDIQGLQPGVENNLLSMASIYKSKTNKPLTINSAKRSTEQQSELYSAHPEKAAPPGLSMHEFGYAVDIDSKAANLLWQTGILDKFGFERPIAKEPWHIEPKGLKPLYSKIRKGTKINVDAPQIGDSENFSSLKKNYMAREKNRYYSNKTSPSQQTTVNTFNQSSTIYKPKNYEFYLSDPYLRNTVYNNLG